MLELVAVLTSPIMIYLFFGHTVVTKGKGGRCAVETIQESEPDVEGDGGGLSREALGNSRKCGDFVRCAKEASTGV